MPHDTDHRLNLRWIDCKGLRMKMLLAYIGSGEVLISQKYEHKKSRQGWFYVKRHDRAQTILPTLHRAGETQPGRNSCPRLRFGFQFGLYHVDVALSVLRLSALLTLFANLRVLRVRLQEGNRMTTHPNRRNALVNTSGHMPSFYRRSPQLTSLMYSAGGALLMEKEIKGRNGRDKYWLLQEMGNY